MTNSNKTKDQLQIELNKLQEELQLLKANQTQPIQKNSELLLNAINKINSLMVKNISNEEVVSQICQILVDDAKFQMAWIGQVNKETMQVEPIAVYGDEFNYVSKIKVYADDRPEGQGPIGIAIRENKPMVVQDAFHDERMKFWYEARKNTTWFSSISIPLSVHNHVEAALVVYSSQINYFSDTEIKMLEAVANSFQNFSERKLAKEELAASKNRYKNLVENLEAGIIVHAPDTRIIKFNRKSTELLGLSPEQMEGKLAIDPTWKFLNEDGSTMPYENYPVNLVLKNNSSFNNLILGIHKPDTDSIVWVDVNGTPIFNEFSELSEILISFFDVTEKFNAERELRLQAELLKESQERYELVNKATRDAIYDWDLVKNEVQRNENYKMFFNPGEELIFDKNWWESRIHPDDLIQYNKILEKGIKEKVNIFKEEYRLRKSDGTYANVIDNFSIIYDEKGKPIRMIGAINDITERKEAEIALKESQERYAFVNKATQDVIFDWDIVANKVYRNANYETLFGIKLDESEENNWQKHVEPNDLKRITAELEKAYESKQESITQEYRFKKGDGSYAIIVDRGFIIYDDNGKPIRMIGAMNDVTEKRNAELELRKNKNRLEAIIANEPECVKIVDANGDLLEMNPSGLAMLEATSLDQVKAKTLIEFLTPEYRQGFIDLHKKVISGESGSYEFEVIGLNGSKRWLETHATPLVDSETKKTSLLGVTRDITARKFAEMSLKSLSTTFSAISGEEFFYNVSKHLTQTLNIDCAFVGRLVKNDIVEVISGYNKGENLKGVTYPIEDTPCNNVMNKGICTYPHGVQQIFPKDAMLVDMGFDSYSGSPIHDKSGKPIGLIVLLDSKPLQNIEQLETVFNIFSERVSSELERMIAEEDLIVSERRLHNILEGTGVGTWEWNVKTGETIFDEAWTGMLGYTLEELAPINLDTWTKLTHPEDLKVAYSLIEKHFNKETERYTCDMRMLHKSGEWIWILDQGKVIEWDTDGKPLLMYGTHTDINIRKNTEELVKKNEIRLSNLIASTEVGYWEWDIVSGINTINERWASMLGYTKEELTPVTYDSWAELVAPDDLIQAKKKLEDHFKGETDSYGVDIRMQHKLGHWVWVLAQGKVIERDENNNPLLMFGTHTDITERKYAELKIATSEAKLEGILNSAMDAIVTIDEHQLITIFNPAAEKMFGFSEAEIIGKDLSKLMPNSSFNKHNDLVRNYSETGISSRTMGGALELKAKRFNGEEFPIEASISQIKVNDKKYFTAILRDITERKRIENVLKLTRFSVENAGDSIYWITPSAKIIDVNSASIKSLGYTREELLNLFVADIDIFYNAEIWPQHFADLREKGNLVFETIQKAKDGRLIPVEVTANYVKFNDEEYNCAFVRDISERKANELRLHTQSKFIETVTNSLPSLIGYWDKDLKNTFANNPYKEYFGKSPKEMYGKTMAEVFGEKVFSEIKHRAEAALRGEEQLFERTIFSKDNALHYTVVQYIPDWQNEKVAGFIALTTDITEIKKTQINLNEAQKIAHIGSWQWDIASDKITWSDEQYRIYGEDKETFNLNYNSFISRFSPETQERINALVQDALEGKSDFYTESEFIKSDGKKTIVIEYGKVDFDSNGKPIRMYGTSQDVTERVKQDADTKFQAALLNSVGQSVIASEPDGTIIYLNKAAEELYGWKIEDALGKNVLNVTVPDVSLNQSIEIMDTLRNGEPWTGEFNVKDIQGNVFPAMVHNSPIFNDKNELVGIIGISTDITEKKEKEQQMKLMESVIINANDSVLITEAEPFDMPGPRIMYVNEAFTKMTGYTADEVIGKTPRILQGPKTDKEELRRLGTALRNWESCDLTVINYKKSGEEFWIHISITPVANEVGWFTHWIAIERDVTLQKLAQEELKLSELRYRELVKNLEVGVVLQNRDSVILLNNDKALELLGLSEDQLLGKTSFDPDWNIIKENGEPFDGAEHPSNISLATKKPVHNVVMGIYNPRIKDRKWILVHANPILNSEGEAIQTIVSFEDITNRRNAEITLKESEQQLRLAIRSGDLGLWDWNAATGELSVNDRWLEMLGLNRESAEPSIEFWHSLVHPEDTPKLEKIIVDTINNPNGTNIEVEVRAKHANGNYIWILDMGNIVERAEDGSPLRIVGTHMDITERKEIEIALKEREEKFRNIINLSPVPYALNDDDNNITYVNEAFTKTFGYTLEDIPTLSEWWPKAYPDPVYRDMVNQVWEERMQTAKKTNMPFEAMELSICCKDGTFKTVKGEAGAISNNYIGTHLVILYDITDRKETEMQLLTAKEKAEESDRLKSAFLANMSHEIRTPMNGILGFTSLLKEEDLTRDEQTEYVGIIEKSGARLLNIINDIIDISKIEAGQIKVFITKTNINEQLSYISDFFKLEAETKGIKLFANYQLSNEQAIILTDKEKLYAALINLTKNALKFTTVGSIEIGYTLRDDLLEFYIKDTGAGIPEEKLELIFERFRQVSESLNRNYEGAGLGLSITKAYIEMLGGRIWAESEVGKGSTFYFTIPYRLENNKIEEDYEEMKTPNSSQKIKVLIAEDNDESEKFLSVAMRKYCSEIIVARNGNEAVALFKANPDIDLIMMDVQMPEINGYEATKQIKAINKKVVIIAQTAHGFDSDRNEAMKIGCDDYISKPIDLTILKSLMEKHFNL